MTQKPRAGRRPLKPEQPTLELFKLADLKPYARNSRTHSPEQVAEIAASIDEFGFTNPVLADAQGIEAGHGRVLAVALLESQDKAIRFPNGAPIPKGSIPGIRCDGWSDAQRRAYVIADNKLALNAGWDHEVLRLELDELGDLGFDLGLTGFSVDEIAALTPHVLPPGGDPERTPAVQDRTVSRPGDVWLLGAHRVMCGDSTILSDVEKLMAGRKAVLIHADPPYGMGKAADGVANDNIYREDLDAFQMEWWTTFRIFAEDNGSAYIWGNAPDLWRLWYVGGLADSERLELRNQIVWDKKSIAGMASPDLTQYPMASEHCLFFQIGQQFLGNVNADDFPEAWEPLRAYMEGEAKAANMNAADLKTVCGCGMYGHWFSRSQFTLMPERHYTKVREAYAGHFLRPWADLKAEWTRVRGSGRDVINGKLATMRSYFDNAHDVMRDVWEFPRVSGEERHGHATPKPVAMMERIMRSSLPQGGLCAEPFGGSGATLIGAEVSGRACNTMELQPQYVDVIVRRWQQLTGKTAVLESDGRTFNEVSKA